MFQTRGVFIDSPGIAILVLHRDVDDIADNRPGRTAWSSNVTKKPVKDPSAVNATKPREKVRERERTREKGREMEIEIESENEREMVGEREREGRSKKQNRKKQIDHPIGGTGEKRRKKKREKVEKPADQPRATVFGRTVRKPEEKESQRTQPPPSGKGT